MRALPGFLLAFTAEGKLLYISENVAEHLGHSMVRGWAWGQGRGIGHRGRGSRGRGGTSGAREGM